MFSFFAPKCPLNDVRRAALDARWDRLKQHFGTDRMWRAKVLLPDEEFFPDEYRADWDGVEALLSRLCGYIGFPAQRLRMHITGKHLWILDGQSCRDPADLHSSDDSAVDLLHETDLNEPLAVVARLARGLASVELLDAELQTEDEAEHFTLVDLLTVYMGLGVITANAFMSQELWHAGAVAGWRMSKQGVLQPAEYGYALARFAFDRGECDPPWRSALRLDVRSPFQASLRVL